MKLSRRIDYTGPLREPVELADGSLRIPAYFAREGVQVYQRSDGSTIREYRPPQEVFDASSMGTWSGLAVTDGHPPQLVTPDNWNQYSMGHIGDNVEKDGTFLRCDAIVKDAKTIAKIKAGELVEISAGYLVSVDPTPGVTADGESYDAIQRNIMGNHIALGPTGWGRAGNDVRLYIGDSSDSDRADIAVCYNTDMTDKAAPTVAKSDFDDLKSQFDKLQAKFDDMSATTVSKADAAAMVENAVKVGVALRADAAIIDPKIDMAKTDREIMATVICKEDATFKSDGRSDDYLRARFDSIVARNKSAKPSRVDTRKEGIAPIAAAAGAGGGEPPHNSSETRDDEDDENAESPIAVKAKAARIDADKHNDSLQKHWGARN